MTATDKQVEIIKKFGLNPDEIEVARGLTASIYHRGNAPDYRSYFKMILPLSPLLIIPSLIYFLLNKDSINLFLTLFTLVFYLGVLFLIPLILYLRSRWVFNRTSKEWIIFTNIIGGGLEHELAHRVLHSDRLKHGKNLSARQWIKLDLEVKEFLNNKK